ncbi:MAG: DNA polymerase III subunit delta' [Gammaproteobacteria bacterium]
MADEACPWHAQAWMTLAARIDGNLPHALLLHGATGTGKRRFAEAFAAFLLCTAPAGSRACGRCKSCQLVAAGSHPDLLLVVPEAMRADVDAGTDSESSGKKRKPSREIRIDEIRKLIGFAAQTAQFSGRRVVVLAPAQAMNTNAANALLKTLEEPGQGTLLLLVTDAPALLPATVRSRCQPLALPPAGRREALAWLAPQVGGDARAEELLNAAGAPLRALELHATDGDWPAMRRTLAKLLVDTLCGEESAVRCAEALARAPEALAMDWLSGFLADAARLSAGAQETALANPDMAALLRRLVESRPMQPLFLLGDDLSRLRQQFQSNSGLNRPLLWEEVLLRGSHRPGRGRLEVGRTP